MRRKLDDDTAGVRSDGNTQMTLTSYAQNFEDVLLWRALRHVDGGTYIDVGAGHPVHHSVTKAFYDAGWSGANVEPLPALASELRRQRPRDLTFEAAVSNTTASTIDLLVVELWDELSTIDPSRSVEIAAEGRPVSTIAVPTVRLDRIVNDLARDEIHFLKVDVEGAEAQVLETLDLGTTRPWIIVCEAVSATGQHSTRAAIHEMLRDARYDAVWFDGLNDFYVANERSAELSSSFGTPVNVTDDFVVAAGTDRVLVDLIGARLDMTPPVQADEMLQRMDAVIRDRITFERQAIEAAHAAEEPGERERLMASIDAMQNELETLRTQQRELQESHRQLQEEARAQLNALSSLRLTNDTLGQAAFERERLIAWYSAELARFRGLLYRAEEQRTALGTHATALEAQVGALLSSTSWRLTMPIRAARRPGAYARKLFSR